MIVIDIEMPTCCDECFALDDHGDYPYCMISHEQRGYTFNVRENRMDRCPLRDCSRPNCDAAEHDSAGCLGYGHGEDDEPIDVCKKCGEYTGNKA